MSTNRHYLRGVQLYTAGQFGDASTALKEALSEEATSEMANDWGAAELACGRVAEAEQGFRQALALDSNNTQASANLGALLASLGRPQEAIPHIEKAIAHIDAEQRAKLMPLLKSCRIKAASDALNQSQAEFQKLVAGFGGRRAKSESTEIAPYITVVNDTEMRRAPRTSLNRIPNLSDWQVGSTLCGYMQALNEGPYIHRKPWEYGMCLMGLHQLGAVRPEASALAVAAGSERPFYYFTNHVAKVVATDLYNNPNHEGTPAILEDPDKYAAFPYRRDRLTVLEMNALQLDFPDDSFDFTFCLSSIEHYGSRENSARGVREMHRVTKPGGIVCIATELILNQASHPEYFSLVEFEAVVLRSTPMKLVGGELDLRITESLIKNPIELERDDLSVSPHIVLKSGNVLWTSLICFLQKPSTTA